MEPADWSAREPEFRVEWEARYGKTGLDWEEIREAHRFGWVASCRPEFADREFSEAEDDLQMHWYQPQVATEETAWDYVREAVLEGWSKARQLRQQEMK